MRIDISGRGFRFVMHSSYANNPVDLRLISESSAIADYEDSFDNPGSSYLWVGENHHLNREEVKELTRLMQYWLDNKRLPEEI